MIFVMQSFSAPCHFLFPMYKYSLQHCSVVFSSLTQETQILLIPIFFL